MASIEPDDEGPTYEKGLWWAVAANHPSGWWTVDYHLVKKLSERLRPRLPWVGFALEMINAEPPLPPGEDPAYSVPAEKMLTNFYRVSPSITSAARASKIVDPNQTPPSKDRYPSRESDIIVLDEDPSDFEPPKGWDDALDLHNVDLGVLAHSYDSHPRLVRGTGADFQSLSKGIASGLIVGFSKQTSPLQSSEAKNKHAALLWPPPAPWTSSDDSRIRKAREGAFMITPLCVFEVNTLVTFFFFLLSDLVDSDSG
jgi:hypothetical protein